MAVVIGVDIDVDIDVVIGVDMAVVIGVDMDVVIGVDISIDVDMNLDIDIGHETAMRGQWLLNDWSMTGEAGCERRINDAKIWSARRRPYISTVWTLERQNQGRRWRAVVYFIMHTTGVMPAFKERRLNNLLFPTL